MNNWLITDQYGFFSNERFFLYFALHICKKTLINTESTKLFGPHTGIQLSGTQAAFVYSSMEKIIR